MGMARARIKFGGKPHCRGNRSETAFPSRSLPMISRFYETLALHLRGEELRREGWGVVRVHDSP
jgi:hypothetical protein